MAENTEKIIKGINSSSGTNRTISLTFVGFLFYVAVTVASTTDMMLLMPESQLELPVLGIKLPLKAFYFVAPVVILIFHYNLLVNLHLHVLKLNKLKSSSPSKEDLYDINPFLVNYLVLLEPGKRKTYLRILVKFVLFQIPLITLTYIMIRFADYQSVLSTTFHFFCVGLDLFLMWLYGREIIKLNEYQKSQKPVSRFSKFMVRISSRIRLKHPLYRSYRNMLRYGMENRIVMLSGIIYGWIILVISGSLGSLKGNTYEPQIRALIPRINVEKEVISFYPDQAKKVRTDYFVLDDEKEIAKKYSTIAGLDLSGRNLLYSNFLGSGLFNTNFEDCDLRFSNFDYTHLFGVNGDLANLKECSFYMANFDTLAGEFYFKNSDLTLAYFRNCSNILVFNDCMLEEAGIINSSLYEYSSFENCNLSNLSIENSRFRDAHFSNCNMKGSSIYKTKMFNCDISQSNILSPIWNNDTFVNVNFFGSNIMNAQLSYCMLKDPRMEGVVLENPDFYKSTIKSSRTASRSNEPDSLNFIAPGDTMLNPYYRPPAEAAGKYTERKDTFFIRIRPSRGQMLFGSQRSDKKYISRSSYEARAPQHPFDTLQQYATIAEYGEDFLRMRTQLLKSMGEPAVNMVGYIDYDYNEGDWKIWVVDSVLWNHINTTDPETVEYFNRKLSEKVPIY